MWRMTLIETLAFIAVVALALKPKVITLMPTNPRCKPQQ